MRIKQTLSKDLKLNKNKKILIKWKKKKRKCSTIKANQHIGIDIDGLECQKLEWAVVYYCVFICGTQP